MEGGGVSFSPVEECTAVLPPLLVSPQSPAPHPHGHLDSGTGAHRLNTTSNSWQDSRASPFLASPAFTGPLSGAAGLACWPLRPLSGVICAGQGPGPGQAAATSLRWGQASLILSWRSWPSPLPVGTRGREMKLQAKQSSERSMVSVSCGKKKQNYQQKINTGCCGSMKGGADYSATGSELGQDSFPANPFFYFLWDTVVRELRSAQLLSHVPTLWDMRSPHGPLWARQARGIIQIRIRDWVAISSSRGSSWPGIEPSSPASKADSLPLVPPAYSSILA